MTSLFDRISSGARSIGGLAATSDGRQVRLAKKGSGLRPQLGRDSNGYATLNLDEVEGREVAFLAATKASVSASGSKTFEFSPSEAGMLDRLCLITGDSDALREIDVTSIKVDNDELIDGGEVPGLQFDPQNQNYVSMGHLYTANSKIKVTVNNLDATNAETVYCYFLVQ